MKKVLALVLAMVMIFVFAGCGTSDQEAETSYEISGDVMEADGKNITIENDKDELLKFNYEGVAVDDSEGLGFDYGEEATISYTGEINGTDTSGCTVTHVVITKGKEKSVRGALEYVDDNESKIAIKNDKSEILVFDVSNAERHYDKGLKIGDDMVVMYMGRINGEDTSHLYVTCVVDETVCNVDTKEETVKVTAVNETVWTKGDVNIREGSSTASEIVKEVLRGTKLKRTGILSNGWSRISYKGKDRYVVSDALSKKEIKKETTTAKTTAKTTAVTTKKPTTTTATTTATTQKPTTTATTTTTETPTTTTEEPTTATEETTTQETTTTPEVGSPLHGIIKDFTVTEENTRMVIDCDGIIYDMDISKAEIHLLEGETIDKKVVVEFNGTIKGTDTSGITVTLVRCDD